MIGPSRQEQYEVPLERSTYRRSGPIWIKSVGYYFCKTKMVEVGPSGGL